jgi:hypothetical protein
MHFTLEIQLPLDLNTAWLFEVRSIVQIHLMPSTLRISHSWPKLEEEIERFKSLDYYNQSDCKEHSEYDN